MNRYLVACLVTLLCLSSSGIAAPKPLYVQVKDGEVRATPTYIGKLLGTAPLGTQMNVLDNKGSWIKVSTVDGKLTGWMHSALLNKTQVEMAAGSEKAAVVASAGEMAAATKGFTPEVEKAFREKNPTLSFEAVDKMEKLKITDTDIAQFLKNGEVKPKEGE